MRHFAWHALLLSIAFVVPATAGDGALVIVHNAPVFRHAGSDKPMNQLPVGTAVAGARKIGAEQFGPATYSYKFKERDGRYPIIFFTNGKSGLIRNGWIPVDAVAEFQYDESCADDGPTKGTLIGEEWKDCFVAAGIAKLDTMPEVRQAAGAAAAERQRIKEGIVPVPQTEPAPGTPIEAPPATAPSQMATTTAAAQPAPEPADEPVPSPPTVVAAPTARSIQSPPATSTGGSSAAAPAPVVVTSPGPAHADAADADPDAADDDVAAPAPAADHQDVDLLEELYALFSAADLVEVECESAPETGEALCGETFDDFRTFRARLDEAGAGRLQSQRPWRRDDQGYHRDYTLYGAAVTFTFLPDGNRIIVTYDGDH